MCIRPIGLRVTSHKITCKCAMCTSFALDPYDRVFASLPEELTANICSIDILRAAYCLCRRRSHYSKTKMNKDWI